VTTSLRKNLFGVEGSAPAAMVNVRYMVDDVDAAIAFYTTHLRFTLLLYTW